MTSGTTPNLCIGAIRRCNDILSVCLSSHQDSTQSQIVIATIVPCVWPRQARPTTQQGTRYMKRAPRHLYAPLPWMLLPCPRSRLRGKNMIVSYLPWGDIAGILVRFRVRSSRRRTRKTSIEWASAARFWLTIFDVPAFICCNRSGQFVVCWFKIMCKHMGIIHAKTVAYHTRSNSST